MLCTRDRRGWRFAMEHAQAAHNEQAVRELPGKVLVSLVQYARPIAERAGDVP